MATLTAASAGSQDLTSTSHLVNLYADSCKQAPSPVHAATQEVTPKYVPNIIRNHIISSSLALLTGDYHKV